MENEQRTQQLFHLFGLIGLTLLALGLSYLMAAPFLPALTISVALAVVLMPLQRWLENKISRPGMAAIITVILAAALVITPTIFIGRQLMQEATAAASQINQIADENTLEKYIANYPRLAPVSRWIETQINLPQTAENAASWLTRFATSFVQGSGKQLTGIVISFYMLFYCLRDRRIGIHALKSVLPLGKVDAVRLFSRVADTVRATIYGTLMIACVQGSLGGLMFWALGLPAALLWGILMGLAAIVPVLGAFIIWIPAALVLFVSGHEVKALALVIWGAIVVGGIDNLLYPMLVGRRLKLHTIPTFISLVGGLIVFGASGLILGPAILAITLFLLEYWRVHLDTSDDTQSDNLSAGKTL
jgi:predicted PurR-regulated permease PerM